MNADQERLPKSPELPKSPKLERQYPYGFFDHPITRDHRIIGSLLISVISVNQRSDFSVRTRRLNPR